MLHEEAPGTWSALVRPSARVKPGSVVTIGRDIRVIIGDPLPGGRRRVTFEYIMLKGVNDSLECADELAKLIRGTLAYVNLIPYNPVKEKPYERSPEPQVRAFWDRLMKQGINTTIRKEFGSDIDAACGQLRVKYVLPKKDSDGEQ